MRENYGMYLLSDRKNRTLKTLHVTLFYVKEKTKQKEQLCACVCVCVWQGEWWTCPQGVVPV